MIEELLHITLHAFIDTAKVLPILFLVYVFIEVIENKCAKNWKKYTFLNNKYSPLIASGVGIIPQCGFSVVATDLYSVKKISVGTLIAVYVATSDEALPILLSGGYTADTWKYVLLLIGIKFVYAVLLGYAINFVVNKFNKKHVVVDLEHHHDDHHDHEEEELHNHDYGCCGHDITEDESTFKKFIMHPLFHSLKICLYILVINLIFGVILEYVGIDTLSSVMLNNTIWQPFIVGLVGLIPNCASSVVITELFVLGGISFASCVTGLCVNAGVALLVLFKTNKNIKANFGILGTLYLASTLLGFLLQFII